MIAILITIFVVTPIIALGTRLYLRRRTMSPRTRIVLAWIVFLFVLIAGPATFFIWQLKGATEDVLSTGRGGQNFLGQFILLWVFGTFGTGAQLRRFCRNKGEL